MNSKSGGRVFLDAAALTRCRHRVFLDFNADNETRHRPQTTGVAQRREAAILHRRTVREVLRGLHRDDWVTIDPDQPTRGRADDTLAACAEGVGWIWGAVLPEDLDLGRRGSAELLVRDKENGGYIPVIVVNHKVTDRGRGATTSGLKAFEPTRDEHRKVRKQMRDQMRLAHLARMLGALDLVSPQLIGGAIGYDADCILVHHLQREIVNYGHNLLQEYDQRFADRSAVARGEVATAPSRIAECANCEWWPNCFATLEETHDVSLVVNGSQVQALLDVGVTTVDQLAAYDVVEPPLWPGTDFHEAQVVARAWLQDVTLIRRAEHVEVQRADVEVDVDMECFQEHGAYLWGTLLTAPGAPPTYRPFVTWTPLPTRDEGRVFAEFWMWLTDVRAQAWKNGLTFTAYCYSKSAENRWLLDSARRFRGMNDIPSEREVQHFIDSEEWVDIFEAVDRHFICPHGRGLKKVAPAAGFHWRDPEAGGEASMAWYRDAVGYEGEPDLAQRERLLRYNEDDVWATKALREWMASGAADQVPLAHDL